MTIEVAAMNVFGAALAADSAISYLNEDGTPTRVFAHANKIFDLSYRGGPVGAMVYGDLSLEGRSWGSLLRLFRASSREVPTLVALANELVDYLRRFLSDQGRHVVSHSGFLGVRLKESVSWLDRTLGEDQVPTSARGSSRKDRRPTVPYLSGKSWLPEAINDPDVRAESAPLTEAEEGSWHLILDGVDSTEQLKIREALNRYHYERRTAGLVLVGYDRDGLMPQLIELTLHRHEKRIHINRNSPVVWGSEDARLDSFSMDDEVRAFRGGVHPEVSDGPSPAILDSLRDSLDKETDLSEEQQQEVMRAVSVAARDADDDWSRRQEKFQTDMLRGLSMLPLRMLAWVSRLQVEKAILRAVTRPLEAQQVAIPVTVALVSRETGFCFEDEARLPAAVTRMSVPYPR